MKYNIITATALLCICSKLSAANAPKNIIYMIGDGMGPAYLTAYRYFNDDKNTKKVESTLFDQLHIGSAQTYPDDNTYVTDSAASATALSTGVKSFNGAIAVDSDKKPLKTMLQIAKSKNMATGLVSTSQVVHATPASFAAHNESRRNYNQIADHYYDLKIDGKLSVDVILGGGTDYFKRDDRDLISAFIKAGYQYSNELAQYRLTQKPALGLYSEIALPYAIDSNTTRLSHMTSNALTLLNDQNNHGFFVMIEASQIDWCGHNNDIACAMAEMEDFNQAILVAKQFVDDHPDTLLVITADHSTGGLTIGADAGYHWHTDKIRGIKASLPSISKALINSENPKQTWLNLTALALSAEQQNQLIDIVKQKELNVINQHIRTLINDITNTGWTTLGHTAVDVPVMAYGQWASEFAGNQDNTDIAKKLIHYIQQ